MVWQVGGQAGGAVCQWAIIAGAKGSIKQPGFDLNAWCPLCACHGCNRVVFCMLNTDSAGDLNTLLVMGWPA